MTDSPSEPGTSPAPVPEAAPAAPRWVKAAAVTAAAVIVLFLVLHLTGSAMGPGMHGGH
ncbi:hypothetical protein ACFV2Z_37065 [Streptomyces sp. NPDC059688]|uniref:hypothetical protein n=1 Tax=Streptomyces sp. NPDC059688 TaxID=3346906 RepID=UPI0036952054